MRFKSTHSIGNPHMATHEFHSLLFMAHAAQKGRLLSNMYIIDWNVFKKRQAGNESKARLYIQK